MDANEFLEQEEVRDIAENHVAGIVKLESAEAARILKLYKQVRQDLRDRLDSMPTGTFTEQRARGVLLQVEAAIQQMSSNLRSEMETSAMHAAEKGVEDLISELTKLNRHFQGSVVPINLDAVVVATNVSNFHFNRYETSMGSYNQSLRARFAQGITAATVEQLSFSEVVSKIGMTFLGEEWRLQRIVRTELHNIYTHGKLRSMTDLWGEGDGDIPDLRKALYHPMDARTADDSKYAESLDLVVPVDEPFKYKWRGEIRSFMAPPDRPNDRSILIPYRDSWNI